MITIHNFPRGARGVRAFWVCEEMGLAYRRATVTFPPSAEYLALNPLGNVPFLEDDGVAIGESVALMLYLAERYGPTPLLPARSDPACARVLQMTVFGETTLGASMNPLMMAKFMAPDADKANWSTRTLEARVAQALDFAAGLLGDGPYFAGETFTLADISISTAFDMWKGALGKPVPEAFAAWRTRVQARPAYQRASAA
ncbi:MAG: glutathione S-transferase family protein [Rhizomicrobium sp.]